MSFVKIDDLWVRYGDLTAVKGLSFEIPKGEVVGFIGPNGAGKTSTIKVLATLLAPSKGHASIGDVRVDRDPAKIRRMIGYMPDFFGVYEDLTVNQYLHFFAAAYRLERRKREAVVGDVLALTDLTEKRHAPVDGLSRGMKQRLGLARVLLHDPDVLLLDEPASGLDPRARIEIRELLKELRRMGKTILISSHILHELAELCNQVGIIERGKLLFSGNVNEAIRRAKVGRTFHVMLTDRTRQAAEMLTKVPGVKKVTLRKAEDDERDATGDGNVIEVVFDDESATAPSDIPSMLVNAGYRINGYGEEAVNLETAFMRLTQGIVQ